MKAKTFVFLWSLGALLLVLPACQGGGGGYSPPAATAPETAPTPATGQTMGPGMQHNFGMMSDNVYQMHRMSQGYMTPDHYTQMMGMMGQMGGMMRGMGMGGPYYSPETEQQQRQQLEQMHQSLRTMRSQSTASTGTSRGGADIFAGNCASCHPHGGNIITPGLPLRGAPQLGSYASFRSLVRQGRGPMPAFPASRLSDSDLRTLYQYVHSTYGG
jgi:mono/diheme cytochrome c family protein